MAGNSDGSGSHYALFELDSGRVVWDMELPRQQELLVSGSRMIIVDPLEPVISCLRLPDRTETWSYKPDDTLTDWINLPGNDLLVLQLSRGTLLALDTGERLIELGRKQWEVNLEPGKYRFWSDQGHLNSAGRLALESANADVSRRILARSETGVIHTLDISGSLLNSVATEWARPELRVLEGSVFVASRNRLLRLDPDSGTVLWKTRTTEPLYTSSPNHFEIVGDRLLVSAQNSVRAFELRYGDLLWTYRPEGERGLSSFPLTPIGEGFVLVPLEDGLVQLNTQTDSRERIIDSTEILHRLGECAVELSHLLEAEKYLRRAVDLDPNGAPNYWKLADIYEQTGENAKAVETLLHYHRLFRPRSPEASAAVGQIRALTGLIWRSDFEYPLPRHLDPVISDHSPILHTTFPFHAARFVDGDLLVTGWEQGRSVKAGLGGQNLAVLRAETGETLWHQPVGSYFGMAGHDKEQLFILKGSEANREPGAKQEFLLSSVNKSTGETKWETTAFADCGPQPFPEGVHSNYVYLACPWPSHENSEWGDNRAFDADTGRLVWKRRILLPSRLDFFQNKLVSTFPDKIQLLEVETGQVSWTYPTGEQKIVTRLQFLGDNGVPDGRIVFATADDRFHCLI